MSHKGVVVAGAPGTAELGADILRQGGHAVDAAVAACMATSAFEPVLTSLAGGGMMLVHDADSQQDQVIDFFSNAPGLGLDPQKHAERSFYQVTVDFGEAQQAFHIGKGAVAVPGTLAGLGAAQQRYGRLPLEQLVKPVSAALRKGVVLDDFQAETFVLLEPILLASRAATELYTHKGQLLKLGDTFYNKPLANSLEQMAKMGVKRYLDQVIAPLLTTEFAPAQGGLFTAQDLHEYHVHFVEPLRRRYRDVELTMPPWPSQGGTLMATLLAMLEQQDLKNLKPGGEESLRSMLSAQAIVNKVKQRGEDPFIENRLQAWQQQFAELMQDNKHSPLADNAPGPGNTTHISVIDKDGNSASVTISYGEGSGVMLGNTGLEMNNFMGELDLLPQGFDSFVPGRRLQTNMCPTRMVQKGRDIVLGSGGSNRIRTAIGQVISRLVDAGFDIEQAVAAGRMHCENQECNIETFDFDLTMQRLHELTGPCKLNAFSQANMFFGGVHLAAREANGELSGAGDPRRSGAVAFA